MTEDQSPRAGDGKTLALLEAVYYALNQAPCDCRHSMRFERGEHMSGCYLFDLNVEYAKTAPAVSAPAGMVLVPKQDIDDARAVLSELYAKYQTKIGPFASQVQRINVAFGHALETSQAPATVSGSQP